MRLNQALHIAIGSIDREIQRYAVNANLFARYHMESGRKAFEKRERLRLAREILIQLEQECYGKKVDQTQK